MAHGGQRPCPNSSSDPEPLLPQVTGAVHTAPAGQAPTHRGQKPHPHSLSKSGSHPPRSEPCTHSLREPGSPRSEAPSTSPIKPSFRPLTTESPFTRTQGAWFPPNDVRGLIHTSSASLSPVKQRQRPHPHIPSKPGSRPSCPAEIRGSVHTATGSPTPTFQGQSPIHTTPVSPAPAHRGQRSCPHTPREPSSHLPSSVTLSTQP